MLAARPLGPGAQGGAAASLILLLNQYLQRPAREIAVPSSAARAEQPDCSPDTGSWGTRRPNSPLVQALQDLTGVDLPDGPELRAFLTGLTVGVALGPLVGAVLLLRRCWARLLRCVEHRFSRWLAGDTWVPLPAHVD